MQLVSEHNVSIVSKLERKAWLTLLFFAGAAFDVDAAGCAHAYL